MVKFFELEWKGKQVKVPYRVSYYALKMLKEKDGIVFSKIDEDDISAYEPLLFYALEQGARVLNQDMIFKREEMVDLLDIVLWEFIKNVPEFFETEKPGVKKKSKGLVQPGE